MATMRKRRSGWYIEVCVAGQRKGRTFDTKAKARAWADLQAEELQAEAEDGIPNRPLGDLLDRYDREVIVHKRGAYKEHNLIQAVRRRPVAEVSLRDLKPHHIAEWRERRAAEVSGSTVKREMGIVSHACNIAVREWNWLQVNPCLGVRRPRPNDPRKRRLTDEEIENLLFALGYSPNEAPTTKTARVGAAFAFAIETAMRAGEIVGLTWGHTHEEYVYLPRTKNEHERKVPLSLEASRILSQLRPVTGGAEDGRVFGVTGGSLDALFRKAKARVCIDDLHFHDSRREALSRLSKLYKVMDLAKISGHRDVRILLNTYYVPDIADLAAPLRKQRGRAGDGRGDARDA